MRNYQRKKNNPYYVPHNVYMQVIYRLKDYNRLIKERGDIMYSTPIKDGQPKGNDISKQTEEKAIKLAYIDSTLEAIDQTSIWVLGELGDKVQEDFNPAQAFWNYDYFNYMHKRKSEDDLGPSIRTWNRFKSRYAGKIAEKLNLF